MRITAFCILTALIPACALGKPAPVAGVTALDAASDYHAQYRDLAEQIATWQPWFDRVQAQAYHPQSLIGPDDRDPLDVALRRTESLLSDLKAAGPRRNLAKEEAALQELRRQAAGLPARFDPWTKGFLSTPRWLELVYRSLEKTGK